MTDIVKNLKNFTVKNSSAILTAIGITGMFSAGVLAVSVTPKALRLMEEKKEENDTDKLTPVEVVKTTWLCYIPAVGLSLVSVICLIEAQHINTKRNMAVAAAYQISERAFKEYRSKVIEKLGEKKDKEIKYEVAKEAVKKKPVIKQEIVDLKIGDTLCYDTLSGRYFRSDIERIKRKVNELNKTLLNDYYISLNDFYDHIGLPYISIGNELGWNLEEDGLIELEFSSQLVYGEKPCLVIDYRVSPRFGYNVFG